MVTSPSDRLRSARAKAGYRSAAEAARARGWKEATYRHHENGTRGFGQDHAKAYARAFHVSASWLLGLEHAQEPDAIEVATHAREERKSAAEEFWEVEENLNHIAKQTLIYHYDIDCFQNSTSGFQSLPVQIVENDEAFAKAFDIDTIKASANVEFDLICSIYAKDYSMAPTINKGALLLVDIGERQLDRQDGLWLVSYGRQVMLRRVRSLPHGKIELYCDNGRTPALVASDFDITICGRIVWIGQSA
jgi:phage repressor protein C with HTH and peptisase S24 domain